MSFAVSDPSVFTDMGIDCVYGEKRWPLAFKGKNQLHAKLSTAID